VSGGNLIQPGLKSKIGGGFIMKIDKSIYEPMLRQAERQLTALDAEKKRLIRVIAGAQRELKLLAAQRGQCVKAVGSVKVLLHLPLSSEEADLCGVPGEKECEILPDAFRDMTLPDAARKLLLMFGRAATNREMTEGLRKGGINQGLKHLENSLRSAMARRPDLFVLIKQKGAFGVWELTEWNDVTAEAVTEPAKQDRPVAVGRGGLAAVPQAQSV
jgi:hypothetical protein